MQKILALIIAGCLLGACEGTSPDATSISSDPLNQTANDKIFSNIPPGESGIDFQNKLIETEASNYYTYMYAYIGGGVAAADFNNDGLEDLFFISNSFDNKLYLNQGDFAFEDYTQQAGIEKRKGFDAGVTIVDINNDGFQDIYISRAGWIQEDNAFANMLYVNNGFDETVADIKGISFTEKAEEYGLADNNRSINATFFDYDKDGDLDVYVSNTPDFEDRAAEILDLKMCRKIPKRLNKKGWISCTTMMGRGISQMSLFKLEFFRILALDSIRRSGI